jgi:hypothetical protein
MGYPKFKPHFQVLLGKKRKTTSKIGGDAILPANLESASKYL